MIKLRCAAEKYKTELAGNEEFKKFLEDKIKQLKHKHSEVETVVRTQKEDSHFIKGAFESVF